MKKLMDKIPALFLKAEELFSIKIICGNLIKQYPLKKLQQDEGIKFVYGIGKKEITIAKDVGTIG